MTRKIAAVIQRVTIHKPGSQQREYHASISLEDKDGTDFGVPHNLPSYEAAGNLLQREVKVAYEAVNERKALYDRGKPVRILITVEDEDIAHLGFNATKSEAAK